MFFTDKRPDRAKPITILVTVCFNLILIGLGNKIFYTHFLRYFISKVTKLISSLNVLWLQVIDLMCGISTRWCSVVLWFLWLYWNLWWTNTSMKNWLQNDVAIAQWTLNTFSDNVHEWIKWKCASSCVKKITICGFFQSFCNLWHVQGQNVRIKDFAQFTELQRKCFLLQAN